MKRTATALKGLKSNGALRQAFETEPSCTQLEERFSPRQLRRTPVASA